MATVKMTHPNNGGKEATANVEEKDVKAWEAKGWSKSTGK